MAPQLRPRIGQREIQALLVDSNSFLQKPRVHINGLAGPNTSTLQSLPAERLSPAFSKLASFYNRLLSQRKSTKITSRRDKAFRARVRKILSRSHRNPRPRAQLRHVNSAVPVAKIETIRPPLLDDEYLVNLALGMCVPGLRDRIDIEVQTTVAILRATFLKMGPDHQYYTRLAAPKHCKMHLQVMQRKDLNKRFRKLPKEIREIIFGLTFEYDGKRMPQLIVTLRPDPELYQDALRAFYVKSTFVLNSKRINALPIAGNPIIMAPAAWAKIRSLAIKHEFIRPEQGYGFLHLGAGTNDVSLFSPCHRCDSDAIHLASNVRVLHLDFSDSYHCIAQTVQFICRLAVTKIERLERLTVTISNIRCYHSIEGIEALISTLNQALRITGRLLAIDTREFSLGSDKPDFTSESWFWQAEPKQWLVWIDHLNSGDENMAHLARLAGLGIQ